MTVKTIVPGLRVVFAVPDPPFELIRDALAAPVSISP